MRRFTSLLLIPLLLLGCEQRDEQPDSTIVNVTRGPVDIQFTLSPKDAQAGEPLLLTAQARTKPATRIKTPLINIAEDGMLGAMQVLDVGITEDIPTEDGGRLWTQIIRLDCFDAGQHEVPAMEVQFEDQRSSTPLNGRIEIPAIPLTITSTIDVDGNAADIEGWRALPSGPWWPWLIVAGLIICVIGAGGFWIITRQMASGPPPTPAEIARAALASLRNRGDLDRGDIETFYVTLSDIIRQYVEGRWGLRAPQKTTSEFLHDAEHDQRLGDDRRQQLKSLLKTADLVKFARHQPSADQGRNAIDQAENFVDDSESACAQELPLEAASC